MNNPVSKRWYADPEARVYGDTLYLYVTRSLPFDEQTNLDVLTTRDLETFEEHYGILDMSTFPDARFAVWAPSAIRKNGKYYLIFAANNLLPNERGGGLYLGESTSPLGPFRNVFSDGRALIDRYYCGAQPIDAHLFLDDDGQIYLFFGGRRHLVVCRLNDEMNGFLPMDEPCEAGFVREITPEEYVEAPYVEKIDGKYHLMYSTGDWTNGSYRVKAAVADSPLSPFTPYGDVLCASPIADGPGHNSAFFFGGKHYTAYHRRIIGDTNAHHRRLCIDEQSIEGGRFHPIKMT